MFLIFYAFCCLGAFCGPVMDLASTWQRQMPGGFATLASMVLALGASIFTSLEGLSQSEAIYASVVTGESVLLGLRGRFGCRDLTLLRSNQAPQ